MIVLIITPTRNVANYLDETIFSLVSQQGNFDLYIHIQDSCSTDGTLDIVHKWKNILESENDILPNTDRVNLSYLSEEDQGMYDAINRGFNHLLAKLGNLDSDKVIMSWINGDDVLTQRSLMSVVNFLSSTSYQWVTGIPSLIREDSALMHLREEPWGFSRYNLAQGLHDCLHFPLVQQEGTFWKKSLWDKTGGLDCRFKLAGDWDLWRRFAEYADLVTLRAVLGLHRRRQGQASETFTKYIEEIKLSLSQNQPSKHINHLKFFNFAPTAYWDAGLSEWIIEKRNVLADTFISAEDQSPNKVFTNSQMIAKSSDVGDITMRHKELRESLYNALKNLKTGLKKQVNHYKFSFGQGISDIVVSHCEVNDRQGVGILLKRIFKEDSSILSLRSQNLYEGAQNFGAYNLCISHDNQILELAISKVQELVQLYNPKRILSVPYFKEDVLNTLALKEIYDIPLCTYLMDDQNIYAHNIPDDLMKALLDKSDLCLGISKELCSAYEEKYGKPFWFLPPVVDSHLILQEISFPLEENPRSAHGVLIGNIWSQNWLDNLRKVNRKTGHKIHWYGAQNREWIQFDESELKEDGIVFKGHYPEDELVQALRQAAYGIVLTGTCDGSSDRPELARLSLPSRLTYLLATAYIPIIVVGSSNTAVAKFVEEQRIGIVCDYSRKDFIKAVKEISSPALQREVRYRAARLAQSLSADNIYDWIWRSLNNGKPINYRFEQLGAQLSDASAVITAIELNPKHGTGPLVKRVVEGTPNVLSIRSMDIYHGEHDFGDLSLLVSHQGFPRPIAEQRVISSVGENTVKQILCVPYKDDDLITSITLSEWQKAPLGTWIMDDQNICADGIPDDLMREFLTKCSLRLATHPEMRDAYEEKYDLKFWLLPAVVPGHLISTTPEPFKTGEKWSRKGLLVGSVWSQKWFEMLSKATIDADVVLNWYGNHQYSWLTATPEAPNEVGINLCGLLPELELVNELKQSAFVIVPTGTLDEQDDRKELSQLSLPGRILFILATSNTPVIIMGSDKTPAAQFVKRFQTGTVCGYDGASFRDAIDYVVTPENQTKMRQRAASVAKKFSSQGVSQWLWKSIKLGKPSDMRFEQLFAIYDQSL